MKPATNSSPPISALIELGVNQGLLSNLIEHKHMMEVLADSDLRKGTTFQIFLPRVADPDVPSPDASAHRVCPRGRETILLVEDEKSVRVTLLIFLKDLGYTVLVAEHPEQAISLAASHSGEIHLLLTDMVMPGMNGRDLSRRLSAIRPSLKTLFISGYTAAMIAQEELLEGRLPFLSKPFSRDDLAHKLREVLDARHVLLPKPPEPLPSPRRKTAKVRKDVRGARKISKPS